MIIVTRPHVSDAELDHIRERVEALGLRTSVTRGETQAIVGCIGDDDLLREVSLLSLPGVESVVPVMKPYKLAAREFAAESTVLRIGNRANTTIGGPECSCRASRPSRSRFFSSLSVNSIVCTPLM